MSLHELRRRQKAFDRLGISIVLAFALGSCDLLTEQPATPLGIGAGLAALLIASRVWLAAGNRKYARTTWSVGQTVLTRTDPGSSHAYQLDAIRRLQAKRTTAGAIREIKLSLDNGSTAYVNGLEDPQEFWECLTSRAAAASQATIREPIDYDHPLFYVALGSLLGISMSLIVRFFLSTAQTSGHWMYVALAAYSFAVGVYWLCARPVSGRYGIRALRWDYAVAAIAFVCFVASAIAAAAL
jgi:hypothetical protein